MIYVLANGSQVLSSVHHAQNEPQYHSFCLNFASSQSSGNVLLNMALPVQSQYSQHWYLISLISLTQSQLLYHIPHLIECNTCQNVIYVLKATSYTQGVLIVITQ